MQWPQIIGEVEWTAVRSRGPGGQNVNKVSSAAQLNWRFQDSLGLSDDEKCVVAERLRVRINQDGLIFLRSDEFRDLPRNKDRCLEKLKALLEFALHRPKPRRATKPTRASKVKRKESKRRRSETKRLRGKVFD
jgi:ribosome-associated protein